MNEQNPYDRLGVTENSSFDEIQAARSRLCAELTGNQEEIKKVEAAYDAVLMDRLRQRQEGKIKVPEGIRFPERLAESPPAPSTGLKSGSPAWLQRLIDTPSRKDIFVPAGIMAALIALVTFVPATAAVQPALILGVGANFYFLYRKEKKMGRAVLLTFVGLLLGLLAGGLLYGAVISQVPTLPMGMEVFASSLTFVILWLVSSFLR